LLNRKIYNTDEIYALGLFCIECIQHKLAVHIPWVSVRTVGGAAVGRDSPAHAGIPVPPPSPCNTTLHLTHAVKATPNSTQLNDISAQVVKATSHYTQLWE